MEKAEELFEEVKFSLHRIWHQGIQANSAKEAQLFRNEKGIRLATIKFS